MVGRAVETTVPSSAARNMPSMRAPMTTSTLRCESEVDRSGGPAVSVSLMSGSPVGASDGAHIVRALPPVADWGHRRSGAAPHQGDQLVEVRVLDPVGGADRGVPQARPEREGVDHTPTDPAPH